MKPSIPKGTRDFSPADMARRNYLFDIIRKTFVHYGFKQIETPAMENLSTLTGKYGEEGDQLLFRVLNSRLHESKDKDLLRAEFERALSKNTNSESLTERALRYDLTVPFARYVAMHQNEITFPFKRYQIQPVWRADRPQKGRYREFYQCDADMIGTTSLLCEAELMQLTDEIFRELRIPVALKMNNRKVLTGIAETIEAPGHITDITVAIDKLDKAGIEQVNAELLKKGISQKSVDALQPVLLFKGDTKEKLDFLKSMLHKSDAGMQGIRELEEVLVIAGLDSLEVDITLARGLNYYTGAIFEVKAEDVQIGSISGGGRYDDLTGIFGLPGVSGVGISYGIDRICDVMDELSLFDQVQQPNQGTRVLFVNFGATEQTYCLELLRKVRSAGISAELYPDSARVKKQLSYADANKIPFVVLVGSEEMNSGNLTVKNMETGNQEKSTIDNLIYSLLKK